MTALAHSAWLVAQLLLVGGLALWGSLWVASRPAGRRSRPVAVAILAGSLLFAGFVAWSVVMRPAADCIFSPYGC